MDDVWRHPPAPARRVGRPDFSRVSTQLLVGEYPYVADIDWLASEHGVSAILNLQDDEDLGLQGLDLRELRAAAAGCGVEFRHVPVPDYDGDRLRARLGEILTTLADLEAAGRVIYIHCNAGLNRAPTAVIAYLHQRDGISLEEACALVKAQRACGPYMPLLRAYFGG